jgi:chorismate mutase-like protein
MKESHQQRAKKLLKPYRRQIDALDDQILELLGARFNIVKKVAAIKSKQDIPSFLHDRVVEVRERCAKNGKKYGIDPDFVRILYSTIIYQSCTLEDEIKHKLGKKK